MHGSNVLLLAGNDMKRRGKILLHTATWIVLSHFLFQGNQLPGARPCSSPPWSDTGHPRFDTKLRRDGCKANCGNCRKCARRAMFQRGMLEGGMHDFARQRHAPGSFQQASGHGSLNGLDYRPRHEPANEPVLTNAVGFGKGADKIVDRTQCAPCHDIRRHDISPPGNGARFAPEQQHSSRSGSEYGPDHYPGNDYSNVDNYWSYPPHVMGIINLISRYMSK